MSQTSFPNTLIYECSSENASVNIASNEWINSFSEGIDLFPGDTIRILGSFINEKGQGDQIEITEENNKFTLEYIPIHNLYQYTKLSDDYVMPNDDSRTKVEKAQFSSILNVDTPRFYDGNGSPIYMFAAEAADESTRADRWYDDIGWNTYNNISGFQGINPNTHYYDCELVKNIACPHVDGIRLEWWDKISPSENPTFYYQTIDFDKEGMPWGGPLSPYAGSGPDGLKELQLAFSSQWVSFVWNGKSGTETAFTMELKKPFGVTGKVMGLRYTTNPIEYIDPFTTQTFAKNSYPIATFMVGDHTIQTKIDPSSINPSGDNVNDMGKGFIFGLGDAKINFDRYKGAPIYNASNGPVDNNGRTWGISEETPNIMFSGFTNGNEDKSDTPIMYDFYCTGPNPNTIFDTTGSNTLRSHSLIAPRCGLYYDSTTEKYYYQIRLEVEIDDPGESQPFLSEYYYSFLRTYDPNNPTDETVSNRVYLPISVVENELGYDNGQAEGTPISEANIGLGQPRKYNTTQGALPNAPTTGGMKLGNWGLGSLGSNPDDYFTVTGDKYQQTIKPGFQTNINMCGDVINTMSYPEDIGSNPLPEVQRKAGGLPSIKYDEQIQDILDYKQDCYLIQSKKANYEVPAGFYTPDRLANVINDLLHLNKEQYDNRIGAGQYTNSNKDDNWCYAPGNINGPFIQTKIPEINGGMIPPDLSDDNLKNPSLSNRPPGITLDSTVFDIQTHTIANDEITAKNLAAGILDGTAIFSDSMKDKYLDTKQIIFCPNPPSKIPQSSVFSDSQTQSFTSLNANLVSSNNPARAANVNGGLWTKWYEAVNKIAEREVPIFMGQGTYTASAQTYDYSGTDFRPDKTGELGEGIIQRIINQPQGNMTYVGDPPDLPSDDYFLGFPVQASFNRTWGGLCTGGLTRFFSGSNDLTFSYDDDEERFSFSSSYTPFRPAGFESSKDKDEFTVDDAVPSVLINTLYNGYNLYATSQIYILNLAAPPVSTSSSNVDDRQGKMPVIKDAIAQQAGAIELWTSLGFDNLPTVVTNDGVKSITGTSWLDDVFFQQDLDTTFGTKPIYNVADVNPSSNAANPAKSQCIITIPNRQFLIQTISDEYKANNPASLTTYPFYLIGSSIPSGFYHGSTSGTELPVVGICSRNFNAGSFVFDLSQSSVEWTISDKTTLTSIHTKILKNNFDPATNLFGNSAVIYAITKQNFFNNLPVEQEQKIEDQREKDLEKRIKEQAKIDLAAPIQPPVQYMIPSVSYQHIIYESDSD